MPGVLRFLETKKPRKAKQLLRGTKTCRFCFWFLVRFGVFVCFSLGFGFGFCFGLFSFGSVLSPVFFSGRIVSEGKLPKKEDILQTTSMLRGGYSTLFLFKLSLCSLGLGHLLVALLGVSPRHPPA